MPSQEFARRVWVEAPAQEVFAWHEREGAFDRLSPPWERVEVVDRTGGIRDGAQVVLRLRAGPLRVRWTLAHQDYIAGQQFRDVQVEGPFAEWTHLHRFVAEGPTRCYLEDRIDYALPLGLIGKVLGGSLLRRKLERLFTYRHRVLVQDLATHRRHRERGGLPLRILVSGASGLVGSALIPFLTTGGHEVTRLVRSTPGPGEIQWNPDAGEINTADLEGFDAVVHLGGENISTGRWTDEKKQRIHDSRVDGTLTLSEALARMDRRPEVLVCASAVGYYGDRGDDVLEEDSGPGSGFLSEVCREWEGATLPASESGVRVVRLRLGAVLSPQGGALARMLPLFRMGLGGRLGPGTQYMSWVSLEDVVGIIYHALFTPKLEGPVNCVSPRPVTNSEFTKALGRVLIRPTLLPAPERALQMALGEMADALLLSSTRAVPSRLKGSGYTFQDPELESALRKMLGR